MHNVDGVTTIESTPGIVRRISWGAVIAGAAVTLAVQLFLGVVGLGIGAATVEPLTEENPIAGIGLGAGIWFAVSTLIALYVGGWVAGRMAGIPRKVDGSLHGILTWSLATLFGIYLLSSAVGGLLGGAAGLLGRTLPSLAEGMGKGGSALVQQSPGLQEVQSDVSKLMSGDGDKKVMSILKRMGERRSAKLQPEDRNDLANLLVAQTDMSRAQAEAKITQWERSIQNAKVQGEEKAREVGDDAAEALATTAGWSALIMFLGAIASAVGGFGGTPRALFHSLGRHRFASDAI